MGWLLRAKSAGKKKPAPRRTWQDWKPSWTPQRSLATIQALTAACIMLGLAVAWVYGERALSRYVTAARPATITPGKVQLLSAPAWMSPAVQDELRSIVARSIDADPLKVQSSLQALAALRSSAWVADVQRIERQSGAVQVQATYRQPVAAVESAGGWHWIDAKGVRLPVTCQLSELPPSLMRILNVAGSPPMVGDKWDSKDVRAALSMVEQLRGQSFARQIKGIDVGARDRFGRIHIVLLSDDTRKVDWSRFNQAKVASQTARQEIREVLQASQRTGAIWGLPPGEEQTVDPLAPAKLEGLLSVLHRYHGSIDARGKLVDVSGATALVFQPVFRE